MGFNAMMNSFAPEISLIFSLSFKSLCVMVLVKKPLMLTGFAHRRADVYPTAANIKVVLVYVMTLLTSSWDICVTASVPAEAVCVALHVQRHSDGTSVDVVVGVGNGHISHFELFVCIHLLVVLIDKVGKKRFYIARRVPDGKTILFSPNYTVISVLVVTIGTVGILSFCRVTDKLPLTSNSFMVGDSLYLYESQVAVTVMLPMAKLSFVLLTLHRPK